MSNTSRCHDLQDCALVARATSHQCSGHQFNHCVFENINSGAPSWPSSGPGKHLHSWWHCPKFWAKIVPTITKAYWNVSGYRHVFQQLSKYFQVNLTQKNKLFVFRKSYIFFKIKHNFSQTVMKIGIPKTQTTQEKCGNSASMAFIGCRLKIKMVFCPMLADLHVVSINLFKRGDVIFKCICVVNCNPSGEAQKGPMAITMTSPITINVKLCTIVSVAYAETFHGGGFIQRHRVVICIGCALFVTSQNDVIVLFPNQHFGEVCWHNMHIFLYIHSSYFMCQCTEHKLLELQVRLSEDNTYTQRYDTAVRNCKKYQAAR